MSSWPLISHFAQMLQNPKVGFQKPELQQCRVELNQIGQPKARSGNFATVYRGYRADNSEFAIRVFNRRQDERLEHYRTVSEYLEGRYVSSIVNFEYDERGIRSAGDGKKYPLLIMEWVPGITLFEWTRDRSRENYSEALLIAADVWLHLVRELADNEIVHGDLQHGNVMVSPAGHFKLVDYDCMCVPSLIGRRNLEIGMSPYQHPGRNAETVLFPGMDNYSSLFIYVALRALAAAPHLWVTYVDRPEYDKLLFRQADFENPAASALYRDLMNSPDEQVRDLSHYLFELYRYDLHDVPPVDEVLLWCESIDSLVSEQQWDKVVQLVQRMGPGEQINPEMQPYVNEAQQRVAARRAMEDALESGDEARAEQLYASGLLNNYPDAAHLLERARDAAAVQPILRILQSAHQLKAYDTLKNTWLANQHLLSGRASAKVYEDEAQKLIAVDRIRGLLAAARVDDRDLIEAWTFLEQKGGHPLAEPFRSEVETRLSRRQGISQLQELLKQAPKTPTLQHDKKIVAACKPEHLRGMEQTSPLVMQYMAASKRMKHVRKVHELEKQGTVESESFIANVMKHFPNSYHDGLARRSQQARRRLFAYQELSDAVKASKSERDIVAGWENLGKVRGRVMATGELRARIELAEARLPLLTKLESIPGDADAAEMEKRVLDIWDEAILNGCSEAEPWQGIYDRGKAVQNTMEQIRQAIDTENDTEVARLLAEPWMENHALPDDLAAEVKQSQTRARQAIASRRQAIVNTLLDNQRATFADLFDAQLITEICATSRHHQPLVRGWVESEILPIAKNGLSIDPENAVFLDKQSEPPRLRIMWNWPSPQWSNECRLVISAKKPPASALPDDVDAFVSIKLTREQWDPATGYEVSFEPEWHSAFIHVWAVVDLGFQVFFSQPLQVGQIEPAPKQHRRWSLFGSRAKKESEAIDDAAPDDDDLPDSDIPPEDGEKNVTAG